MFAGTLGRVVSLICLSPRTEFCVSEVCNQGMEWLISAEASPGCADGVLLLVSLHGWPAVSVSYLPLLTIELRPTLMALL